MRNIHYDDRSAPYNGGELLEHQAEALRPHVLGRHVHDLGAGNGQLGALMLALGARALTLVDHSYRMNVKRDRVELVGSYLHEYAPTVPPEVALVSWPPYLLLDPPAPHIVAGLPNVCAMAPVVVYLGSNFGTVCGNPELWQHLGTREVLDYVPHERNSLIVYGRQGARIPGQGLLPEEKAALYRHVCPLPVYGVTYG